MSHSPNDHELLKCVQDKCIEIYDGHRRGIRSWYKDVRDFFQTEIETGTSKVHYLRGRLKDTAHLREKISRKWIEKYRDKLCQMESLTDEEAREVFFSTITDLAGVRVLVLYRDDLAAVDEIIWSNPDWKVEECVAHYDAARTADFEWFNRHGFVEEKWLKNNLAWVIEDGADEEDVAKNLAKSAQAKAESKERAYSSIHYLVRPLDDRGRYRCEIQVRTIHQEAWGEFDHELKYPNGLLDPLASDLIARLGTLLHLAEDIVQEIRKNPVTGILLGEFLKHAISLNPDEQASHGSSFRNLLLTDVLPAMPHLYRAAPLAAIDLLSSPTTSDRGPRNRIVTLDFGSRSHWSGESFSQSPVRSLYLEAHKHWLEGSEGRQIRKYFVWDEHKGESPEIESDLLSRFCSQENWEIVAIPLNWFMAFHRVVEEHNHRLRLGRVQFFLWDLDQPACPPATVPNSEEQVLGFYSPALSPELTGGIRWLRKKPEPARFQILRSYAKLLDELVEENHLSMIDLEAHGGLVSIEEARAQWKKDRDAIKRLVADSLPAAGDWPTG